MASLLVKNCSWIVTQNAKRDVLQNGHVLIQDGIFKEVGRGVKASADIEIDGNGKIALPGLINTHTHLSMTLFRGLADDMQLQDWLQKKIWPLEAKLTDEACYNGALLGSAEMILSGTTCLVDMYFHMEHVSKAVEESGLRGFLSYGIMDLFDPANARLGQETSKKFFDYVQGLDNPRIRFAIGLHAPYTCSAEMLLWAKDFGEKNDSIIHIHVAETRKEQADFQKQHGMRVVEYLDKIGALSRKMLAAHCVWLTKSEVGTLAKAGVTVAHCPVSNMKLASGGVAPLPEMFELDMAVGLGTDGAASNNTLDMFETMKVCALLHKAHRWDATVLNAQRVLDLATIEGARALGVSNELGSIEPGKRADLILVNMKTPNMTPIFTKDTVVSDLVYSASSSNVDTTIVDGNVLMQNRKLTTLNQEEVMSKAQEIAERLARA
ncbi:MAG: amidohydrolase [Candidatus Bathyarchaeia archaeon]|jgi:5-methylthioadenosine/S-adenosylhomocysteine deaminase